MGVMVYVVIVPPRWVYVEYLHIYRVSSQTRSLKRPNIRKSSIYGPSGSMEAPSV